MCHFMFLSEISGPRWIIMGMVVKLAQSVSHSQLIKTVLRQALTYVFYIRLACVSKGSSQYLRTSPDFCGILIDRDSGKWNLDPEQTQKRRDLFYELLTYDSWQASWSILPSKITYLRHL